MDRKESKDNPLRKMSLIKLAKSLDEKSKKEIIDDYIKLYKKNKKLENELKKYKNANTPSSANKHLKKITQGLKAKIGAKRGAPKGHKGFTLILDPTRIFDIIAKQCGYCYSRNVEPTGYVKKKKIVCLQKAKIIVKQYNLYEIRCLNCNRLTLARHKEIPKNGVYDKRILSLVNYLRFKSRLTHNRIVDFMNNVLGVPMTNPTSLNITNRVSRELEPEYQKLEVEVKELAVVNADETSHSVDGVNQWIWVFCNSWLSLFKFHPQRGGDIVEKTLGNEFTGKLVVDGWRTYKAYSEKHDKVLLQRCWDHGKREAEFECKKKHPDLYKWFCDIYYGVKRGKSYKQEKRRLDKYQWCKNQLKLWIGSASSRRSLRKFANKMENGGDDWFTCMLYPEVPMDNNEAERSLRPIVVLRKIIGCLRNNTGVRTHEIMMSLISTWEKQNKNVFYTLQNTI